MANTIEVGLNTGTIGFWTPNNPFKDLIRGSTNPYLANVNFEGSESLSGVLGTQNYSRVYYVPSSFPHNVSTTSPRYLFISEQSDGQGWPTSAPYADFLQNWQRRINYTCINELVAGTLSAVLPPSSTDNPNEATFHVLWDGAGTFDGSRTWYVNYQYDNDVNTNAQATIVDVSAGEAKLTGLDTTRLSRLQLVVQGHLIDPSDHMRNIRLVHQDYRDNFESEPFYPLMVDYYKGMTTSGGAVRNMKWAKTNSSKFGIMTSVSGDTFDLSSTIVRDFMTQGGELGMAYTTQAQFANAIERDLWINIHYISDDATVSAIASGVAATLNSNRKIYVELGNEWWNSAYPYSVQRIHFTEQAQANGGSSVYWLPEWNDEATNFRWPPSEYVMGQAYAVQRSIEIFNIFSNYFSSDRLVRVIAGQNVFSERNKGMLLFSSAYNYVDMLAVNPYVGSFLGNLSGAASAVAASAWTVDDLFNFMYDAVSGTEIIQIGTGTTEPLRMAVGANYDMLQASAEFSGIKLGGYEGGDHLNVNQSSRYSPDRQDDRDYMISLIASSQYDSRWEDWHQYLLSSLDDMGMSHYVHFVDMSNWSPSDTDGTWEWFGTVPHLDVQTPSRTGIETYVASYSSPVDPDPDPDPDPSPIRLIEMNLSVKLHF
jgi:hypothetical protein